ncbi:LysR family transcriptional regulator [Agromyces aurantiacus]|uniref:LysR family transcriptional regulator n=1 Tax=Agromyces aurantiacus TaxID=165814 RepID=A0ABV9R875_9MICO|nr:LysR family transcriptional regulator [Agromyces aurantiacus]MBM7504750.1 DNA-binding transcriptional LysR family regulator [Agromyces aurantiacus]
MELRHLRWFIAVVEAGSLSSAARSGHITQPALSVMIAQLERDLGARLLERSRDGVQPTSAGSAVLEIARRMVDDAELVEAAARAGGDRVDEVRLAIADPGLLPLVAGAVAAAGIAGVPVKLVVGRHRPWEVDAVLNRSVHLAVVTSPILDRRVRTAPLTAERRGILVGPRNELFDASDLDVTFELLARHAAIDPVDTPEAWTDEWAYRPQMNGERMRQAGPPVDSMTATFLSSLTTEAVAFVPRQIGMIGQAMGLRYLEPRDGPPCEHLMAWRPPLSASAGLLLAAATASAPGAPPA